MYMVIETQALAGEISHAFLDYVQQGGFTVMKGGTEQLEGEQGRALAPTQAAVDAAYEDIRAWLYREKTDPLFMKTQRGEGSLDQWKAAVAEVKARWAAPALP